MMLNPNDFEPFAAFNRQYIARLSGGDRILHGMLYPGIYPGEDEAVHAQLLRGEQPELTHPFFELVRTLVERGVAVDRLRVLPTGGAFSHNLNDVRAMVSRTAHTDQATGMKTRHVSFYAAETALKAAFPEGANQLADDYLSGAYERSPHNSFWMVQRRIGDHVLKLTAVGLMWYENREPLGIKTYTAPAPTDIVDYANFWNQQYATATVASTAHL